MQKKITIVIPIKNGGSADITLKSLEEQTFTDFDTIVIDDENRGANWARNEGFKKVKTEFVLFSDDDINWDLNGIAHLYGYLMAAPEASFSYGSYKMGDQIFCDKEYDAGLLMQTNYISTMSLIRSEHFPGFDENIKRLQDWDLWLNMLRTGKIGVYCKRQIFTTEIRDGISYGKDSIDWTKAVNIIKAKYKI